MKNETEKGPGEEANKEKSGRKVVRIGSRTSQVRFLAGPHFMFQTFVCFVGGADFALRFWVP